MRACEDRSRRDPGSSPRGVAAVLLRQLRERAAPLLTECDVCGSADLAEIRCKVICRNCRTILQSCADL